MQAINSQPQSPLSSEPVNPSDVQAAIKRARSLGYQVKVIRGALGLLLAITGFSAHAIKCETDQDCFGASVSLIKASMKLGQCSAEAKALADSIAHVASPSDPNLAALASCVEGAKYDSKTAKRRAKRVERIQKALSAREPQSEAFCQPGWEPRGPQGRFGCFKAEK